ncbi:GIY-YIG nuclease family protein [Candidatus Bipolaricaulota bacterium]
MSDVMRITNNEPAFSFDAKRFPEHPGCYLMKGEGDRVLYVGKAVNLRGRLSSYFRVSKIPHRKAEMITRIRDIEVILVRNERQALI